jgi:hypothetical protein
MGSRQSNTSWCWSPRQRCPEHTPLIKKKTFEEEAEERMAKTWWVENRWRFVEGRDPNILGIGDCDRSDNPQSEKTDKLRPDVFQ